MLTNSGQLSVNSAKAALLKAYRPIANPEELVQTINKSQYSVAGIYYACPVGKYCTYHGFTADCDSASAVTVFYSYTVISVVSVKHPVLRGNFCL